MQENPAIRLTKERLLNLHKTRKNACIACEDMFWSPQEKEKYLNQIDKEIELTEEYLEELNARVVELPDTIDLGSIAERRGS